MKNILITKALQKIQNIPRISILLLASSIVFGYIYFHIESQIEESFHKQIINKEKELYYFAQNIEKMIKSICPKDLEKCLYDQDKKKLLTQTLSIISNPYLKYIYILKEKNSSLYYLADGSNEIQERGSFLQKFDLGSDIYKKALNQHKPIVETHKTHKQLWLSYYYPLNKDTFLVFDLSIENLKELNSSFLPIHSQLRYMVAITFFLFLFSLLWAYLYIRQHRKSHLDPLTKLYNRNILSYIKNKINLKKDAILTLDIDHFKKINDSYGHDIGDKVIQSLADIILRSIEPKDIAVRTGGEEFLIILKDITKELSEIIAERLRKKVAEFQLLTHDHNISYTISIGVVPPNTTNNFDTAIKQSDQMLYISKINGRNRVTIYGQKNEDKRSLILDEVIEAINNDQLLFYYQPIYHLKEKKIVKYEVLVRLQAFGFIYTPFEFLPLIKNSNPYRTLSKKLIQNSIEIIKKYHLHLSLNFDAHDFLDDTIYEMIADILENDKEIAKYLTIELLEDLPIKNMKKVRQRVLELKKLGLTIAIDDFGDGYSSIKYIICFAPDIVKIDRSILLILQKDNSTHNTFLQSLIDLLHNLNIQVVMEGVETKEDIEYLRSFNIDMVQGYYIAKPSSKIITDADIALQEQDL